MMPAATISLVPIGDSETIWYKVLAGAFADSSHAAQLLASLRLQTGRTCFDRPAHCTGYSSLTGNERKVANEVVARWGSERWVRR